MTSAISKTDICNLALDMLKEAVIADFGDDDPVAAWFRRNYAVTRDAILAEHPWNFAVTSVSLPERSTPPVSRWLHGYNVPADSLRILPLQGGDAWEGTPIPHQINGQVIETDAEAPLIVRYIRRVDEEGLFSPLFIEAFSARLAMKAAHWITGKTAFVQIAQALYAEALTAAKRLDGQEGHFERSADDDVIAVRG